MRQAGTGTSERAAESRAMLRERPANLCLHLTYVTQRIQRVAPVKETAMEEDAPVRDEIAATAQEIWNLLDKQGPSPLDQVRQTVRSEPHIFEWAVGWLAREDKIAI